MHLIRFVLIGLGVGVATWWVVRGREPGGWLISMFLGVLGSLAVAFLGPMLKLYTAGQPISLMVSFVAALALVATYAFGTRVPRSSEIAPSNTQRGDR